MPMPMQVPAHHLAHAPVPVHGYPGLPRHAIAHHDRQLYHRQQRTNWDEELNRGFQHRYNARLELHNTRHVREQHHEGGMRVPRENIQPPPPQPEPEQQNVQQVSYAEYIQLYQHSYYLFFGLFNSLSSIIKMMSQSPGKTLHHLLHSLSQNSRMCRSVMQNTSSFISNLTFFIYFG